MTYNFLKRNSYSFFRGKKARVLREQMNMGGEVIPAGTLITVVRKQENHLYLDIETEDKKIRINGVDGAELELIK
jgi:hypothetical protein